jgi:hypothetical protein
VNAPNRSAQNHTATFIAIFSALLLLALRFPMVTDEAYYIDWARRMSWPAGGFFDHPPMVSWIASFTRVFHSISAARIFVWLTNILSLFFTWKSAAIILGKDAQKSVLMLATSIGGIAASVLLTPDTGLILCWNASIYFALLALSRNPRFWIAAGVASGLGLWSKYTMVLIGPVFLWGLLTDNRRQLTTRWPWLGAAVCVFIFAPHIWWQSQHNWLTFKFQFGHGFSVRQSLTSESILPEAAGPKILNGREHLLVNDLMDAIQKSGMFKDMERRPTPEKSEFDRRLTYLGDFAGGVLGLWGAFVPVMIFQFFRKRRKLLDTIREDGSETPLRPPGLITASAFFPLIFFGLIAPFSKIEANWPAMHMSAMSIWIMARFPVPFNLLRWTASAHLIIAAAMLGSIYTPELVPGIRANRILRETAGFSQLGTYINNRFGNGPVAVDSYQLKSALAYYAPGTAVTQWPGITRGSEYTRGAPDDQIVARALLSSDKFSIVSMTPSPRVIPGFVADKLEGVRVCPDGSLGLFSSENPRVPCESGIREWWITTYFRSQNPR